MADELKKLVKRSKGNTKKSLEWFKRKAQNFLRANIKDKGNNKWIISKMTGADKELKEAIKTVSAPMIGHLYFFQYDPKWKVELPYYDTLPLVIPIDYKSDGFLGLNMHYLPPIARAALLDELLKRVKSYPNTSYGQKQYTQISYSILQGLKNTAYKATIKRYLYSHFRSKLGQVDFSEWENAVFLPVENFKKANKRDVWRDSKEFY